MPMPVDVYVTMKNGSKKIYYAPLGMMRGEKANDTKFEREVIKDWAWTHENYTFQINAPLEDIASIEIDESGYMADVNRENNKWEQN